MRSISQDAAKNGKRLLVMEILILIGSVISALLISQYDFGMAAPLVLGMVGFILMRYVLSRPFHEAFTLYLMLSAFNYYYFYCAKLNGRNPTDVGTWGIPATPLEKAQKDIVFFLFMLLAGVKLWQTRLEGERIWSRKLDHPIAKLTLVFIGYTLIRGIFWLFQDNAATFDLLFYLRTNIEFAVIPLLMCTALFTREKHLRLVFKGIIYALPIVAILGIIEFLIHGSPYERSFYGGQVFYRAASTLQNPNNLGGYLAVALGVYIIYFFHNQLSRFERWMFWPTMPLGFTCLFMTLSRSSILFFFISITLSFALLYITSQRRMARDRYRMCKNLMIVYVVILGISMFVLNRYFDFDNAFTDAYEMYVQQSYASNYRLYAPLVAFGDILANPLTALFGYTKQAYYGLPDNALASILIRNGIVGFLVHVGIWISAIVICLRKLLASNGAGGFLYLLCFYILSFQALYAFSAAINQNFPHNMYFWFTIGTVLWLESRPASRSAALLPEEEPGAQTAEGS